MAPAIRRTTFGNDYFTRLCLIRLLLLLLMCSSILQPIRAAADFACDFQKDGNLQNMAFCNISLSDEVRVQDLVSRMTLQEKVSQLGNTAGGMSRLGIPAYQWWQEGLHGVAHVGFGGNLPQATSFPLPILTTASFNKSLWNQIGQVVSTEARAFYNQGMAGLTYWSPVINIVRDPRWGRVQETSGEDPVVTSSYAVQFVRGLQEGGDSTTTTTSGAQTAAMAESTGQASGPRRLKVSACCKHFTAYDVDNWEGVDRFHFDAKVTAQDLADTYNPPFQSCVQDGRSSSLMCSYNKVNGVPTCANHDFLVGTVRNTWGLDGYIVSDCDSVQVMHESTNYATTPEDAVADALNAGLDLNCGDYLSTYTAGAIAMGKVKEANVDAAVSNLFMVRMRLGMFDGNPEKQPFGSIGVKDVCSAAHQELAVEAARQGIVLLKNEGNTLPLSRSKRVAVIGPNANATHVMLGDYEGVPCKYITPLQGMVRYANGDANKVVHSMGCINTACEHNDQISAAVSVASSTDAVVLIMGLSQVQESEALDRTSLRLPGYQEDLISEVVGAASGRPVVLVLMCAGPVDIDFAKKDSRIQSILWVGYPGEAGGQAIAEVIYGDHNPGGKLPVSWYPEEYTKISMTDMRMRPDSSQGYPGRTYRFYTGNTIYDFGYGLSYSNFKHSFLSAPMSLTAKASKDLSTGTCTIPSFDVEVEVMNAGSLAGRQPVLLFTTPPRGGLDGTPVKQLVAFESVHVVAGARRSISFTIHPCVHLASARSDGTSGMAAGTHTLSIGDVTHSLALVVTADTNSVASTSSDTTSALPGSPTH